MQDEIHPSNIIKHGSMEAASYMGLIPADKSTDPDLVVEDEEGRRWTLADANPYGVLGFSTAMKRELLRQKVSDAMTPPPTVQDEDPSAPNYAPPPWMPREPDESPVRGII